MKADKIIFATGNAGKMKEIRMIMADLNIEVHIFSMLPSGYYTTLVSEFPSPSGVSIFSILPRPARCLSLSQHRFAGEKNF